MSQLNREQLQAAYAQIAKRDWPPLEELLQATYRFELVIGQALRSTRHVPRELLQRAHATPQTRQAPTAPKRPAASFDIKRAAAGERPDDDD